jgi:hypothetical protein
VGAGVADTSGASDRELVSTRPLMTLRRRTCRHSAHIEQRSGSPAGRDA